MKTTRPSLVLTAIFVLLLSSCAVQYHGVHPVSPTPPTQFGAGPLMGPDTVDSLQPTLSWKPVGSYETKYDLIVYTGVVKPLGPLGMSGQYYVRGQEVYYREGIEGGSHHIEQPLESRTVYVWSIRTRSGPNVGPWSTYDFQRGYLPVKGLAQVEGANLWWSFKTPKQ